MAAHGPRSPRPRPGAPAAARAQPSSDPDHVALVHALRELPEAQRRAIVLHHMCDLPVVEVAAETGVPVGTVKARLSRGRTALMSLLGDGPADDLEGVSHA